MSIAMPFADVYAAALSGLPCRVVGRGDAPALLPTREWTGRAGAFDRRMLGHCLGAVLDVGCGPGRMSAHLAEQGHPVLGIDLVGEAVARARRRGVAALRRDVFAPLPGEGRWATALLADGNIGIGGDPVRLLRRLAVVLAASGRVVLDLSAPGTGVEIGWVRLEAPDGMRSRPFRWAWVGVDVIDGLALDAGFGPPEVCAAHGRWFAVIERD